MALSLPTRMLIAKQFGIAKVGSTHVADNRILSDGYKIEDVERALNTDAIQLFVGTEETDAKILFDLLVAKIEGRVLPTEKEADGASIEGSSSAPIVPGMVLNTSLEEEVKPKRVRKPKKQ